ncbi:hypothetical protein HF086_002651 [Spodoptera exigua]|uniref:CUB domain-containing protein n=1 Tax=Spodoptera exigua TaxID=7107 RepID=A0A922SLB0_SPOEX|nr:hypothetical protein HF086_002651 [Spodoptera exigua]
MLRCLQTLILVTIVAEYVHAYEINKEHQGPQPCGGRLKGPVGTITTPNFPNPFPVPIKCKWIIEHDIVNGTISIYFTQQYTTSGLTFNEYMYYDESYKLGERRALTLTDENITRIKWLQVCRCSSRLCEIAFKLDLPTGYIACVNHCLTTGYFLWRGEYYLQVDGVAMGSPLAPVVANIFMEWFEGQALASAPVRPRYWWRYVDDVFAIINREHVAEFVGHLNSVHGSIQFTTEEEREGMLPFLDVLEIESRSAIWDMKSKPYSDRLLKMKQWEEIVTLYLESGETSDKDKKELGRSLQIKWKNLRDAFMKEYRRQKNIKSGAGAKKNNQYRFYNQLLFLNPYAGINKTENSLSAADDKSIGEGKESVGGPYKDSPKRKKSDHSEEMTRELIDPLKSSMSKK